MLNMAIRIRLDRPRQLLLHLDLCLNRQLLNLHLLQFGLAIFQPLLSLLLPEQVALDAATKAQAENHGQDTTKDLHHKFILFINTYLLKYFIDSVIHA